MSTSQELLNELSKFWTAERYGKHKSVARHHEEILNTTLKVKPNDLFEQIYKNKFIPQAFELISWQNFLNKTNLAEYLDSSYVERALSVTDVQPAIGKGEFLLVSCFGNLGFSSEAGDLITLDTHEKIELKGNRATLSSIKPSYKSMNSSVMTSIFNDFNNKPDMRAHDYFNKDDAANLDTMLRQKKLGNSEVYNNILIRLFNNLQNVKHSDSQLARVFADYYAKQSHPDLFQLTAALHLCIYFIIERPDFLILTNKNGFCCVKNPLGKNIKPSSVSESNINSLLDIVNNIKVSTWNTDSSSVEISI